MGILHTPLSKHMKDILENSMKKLRVSARKVRWTFHSFQEACYGGDKTYRVILMQPLG